MHCVISCRKVPRSTICQAINRLYAQRAVYVWSMLFHLYPQYIACAIYRTSLIAQHLSFVCHLRRLLVHGEEVALQPVLLDEPDIKQPKLRSS